MLSIKSKNEGGGFIRADGVNIIEVMPDKSIFLIENGVSVPISRKQLITKSLVGKVSEDFDIPMWAREISIIYTALQLSGTAYPALILYGAASEVLAGSGSVSNFGTSSMNTANLPTTNTTALINGAGASTNIYHGVGMILSTDDDGLSWVISSSMGRAESATNYLVNARKSGLTRLERIRIIGNNGTDTFTGTAQMSVLIKG